MRLYAALDDFLVIERADESAEDSHLQEVAEYVEEEVTREGQLDPDVIAAHFELEDDLDTRCYAYLRGIDAAMQLVHPDFDCSDRGALDAIATRFRRLNRFNRDANDGALLPRFAFPHRFRAMDDEMAIEHKSDLFENVTVADASAWAHVRSVRIARHHSPPSTVRLDGLAVGCAPMCSGDDVEISCDPPPPRRRYLIAPSGGEVAGRIGSIVEQLDSSGAHIALMPELTLSCELLAAWRDELAAIPPPRGSQLRLLMVGTGPLETHPDGRVVNRGVLLHRSGRQLLVQDKRHPFTLDATTIEQWGLVGALGKGPAAEPIVPGRSLCVAEGPFGRLVILVCEDLGRTVEDGALLLAVGPSLCLAPVLSKPTLEHYWEHSRAKALSAEIGSNTVVSNSFVVADRQRDAGFAVAEQGTALAHTPTSHVVAVADGPGETVVLRLHPDGAFLLATARRGA